MTKESILDQHVKYAWECDQASPVIPYSEAEKAMDEYAKQKAVAFLKWALESDNIVGDNYGDAFIPYPTTEEELYSQFIEQQTKE
jgi:hypothetical protein